MKQAIRLLISLALQFEGRACGCGLRALKALDSEGATGGATALEPGENPGHFHLCNRAKSLNYKHPCRQWTLALIIRNQQVASSILAGGSISSIIWLSLNRPHGLWGSNLGSNRIRLRIKDTIHAVDSCSLDAHVGVAVQVRGEPDL